MDKVKVGDRVEVIECALFGKNLHEGMEGKVTEIEYHPEHGQTYSVDGDSRGCIAKTVKLIEPKAKNWIKAVPVAGDTVRVRRCRYKDAKHEGMVGTVVSVETYKGDTSYDVQLFDQRCNADEVILVKPGTSADSGEEAIPEKKQRWLVAPNDKGRSALYSVNEYGVTKYETDEDNNAPGIWALLVAGVEATKNA